MVVGSQNLTNSVIEIEQIKLFKELYRGSFQVKPFKTNKLIKK